MTVARGPWAKSSTVQNCCGGAGSRTHVKGPNRNERRRGLTHQTHEIVWTSRSRSNPAPSHMMPSRGAESGHKEGTKFRLRRLVLRAGCGYSWIMSGRAQKLLGEALDLTDEERARGRA